MRLFFLGDKPQDLLAMIGEITQCVEDLGLGNPECLGDLDKRLALPVQRDHVTDRYPQSIDYRLAAANAFKADNVRMLGPHGLGHARSSK